MSDLEVFREVDEDYRRERMIAFWRRYGVIVFILVLLALAAAWGGTYFYQREQDRKADQSAELNNLIASVKPGEEAKAADALASYAAKADTPHALLAHLAEASLRQRVGALDAAAAIYRQIADDSSVESDVRDLALVRLGAIAVDQAKPDALIPRLEAIVGKNSPWRYSAREIIALLTIRAGQQASGAKMFSDLAQEQGVPPDLAERAHALADLYSGK